MGPYRWRAASPVTVDKEGTAGLDDRMGDLEWEGLKGSHHLRHAQWNPTLDRSKVPWMDEGLSVIPEIIHVTWEGPAPVLPLHCIPLIVITCITGVSPSEEEPG